MIADANAVEPASASTRSGTRPTATRTSARSTSSKTRRAKIPTRRIQKSDLMRLVTKGLNRNERLIIILYYYEELTMKEIGATLDLSRKPRQPDAQRDRAAAAEPARHAPAGVRRPSGRSHAHATIFAATDDFGTRHRVSAAAILNFQREQIHRGNVEAAAGIGCGTVGALGGSQLPASGPRRICDCDERRIKLLRPGLPIVAAQMIHRLGAVVPIVGVTLGVVGRGVDVFGDRRRLRVGGRAVRRRRVGADRRRRIAEMEFDGQADGGVDGVPGGRRLDPRARPRQKLADLRDRLRVDSRPASCPLRSVASCQPMADASASRRQDTPASCSGCCDPAR